nr:MAG: RNA-dependent RNA polymerase [Pseudoscorpian picorna-like virus 4]
MHSATSIVTFETTTYNHDSNYGSLIYTLNRNNSPFVISSDPQSPYGSLVDVIAPTHLSDTADDVIMQDPCPLPLQTLPQYAHTPSGETTLVPHVDVLYPLSSSSSDSEVFDCVDELAPSLQAFGDVVTTRPLNDSICCFCRGREIFPSCCPESWQIFRPLDLPSPAGRSKWDFLDYPDVELQGWSARLLKIFSALTEDDEGYKDPIVASIEFVKAGKDMLMAWMKSIYKFISSTVEVALTVLETWCQVVLTMVKCLVETFKSGFHSTYVGLARLLNNVFGTTHEDVVPDLRKPPPTPAPADPLIISSESDDEVEMQSDADDTWSNYAQNIIDLVVSFITGVTSLLSTICEGIPKIASKFTDGVCSISKLVSGLKAITPVDTLKRCANCIYFFFTGNYYFMDLVVMDAFKAFQTEYTYDFIMTLTEEQIDAARKNLKQLYSEVLKYDAHKFNVAFNSMIKMFDDAYSDRNGRTFIKLYNELAVKLEDVSRLKVVDYTAHKVISTLFKTFASSYDALISNCARANYYSEMYKRTAERVTASQAAVAAKCRIKPVVVCIRGKSATGKTRVLNALTEDIPQMLRDYYSPDSPAGLHARYGYHALNPAPLVYACMEKPEDFDSTYNRQMFIIFNELHSHIQPASQQAWAEKFVAFCDDSPLNLKRAFSDKGQVYMTSPFVFASGNFDSHTIIMNDADAQYRRIELDLIAIRTTHGDHLNPRKDVKFKITPECIKILASSKTPSLFLSKALLAMGDALLDYDTLSDLVSGAYIARLHENVHDSVIPNCPPRLNRFFDVLKETSLSTQDQFQLQVGGAIALADPVDNWADIEDDTAGLLFAMQFFLSQKHPYVVLTLGELFKLVKGVPFRDVLNLQTQHNFVGVANPFQQWMCFTRSLASLRRKYAGKADVPRSEYRQLRRTMSYIRAVYRHIRICLTQKNSYADEDALLQNSFSSATPSQQTKINTLYRKRYKKVLVERTVSVIDGVKTTAVRERSIVYTPEQKAAYRDRVAANKARGSALGALPKSEPAEPKVNPSAPKARNDNYARKRRDRNIRRQRQETAQRYELQVRNDTYWIPKVYAHDRYQDVVDVASFGDRLHIIGQPIVVKRVPWRFRYRLDPECLASWYFRPENKKNLMDYSHHLSFWDSIFRSFGAYLSPTELAKLHARLILTNRTLANWYDECGSEGVYSDYAMRYAYDLYARTQSSVRTVNFLVCAFFSTSMTIPIDNLRAAEYATSDSDLVDNLYWDELGQRYRNGMAEEFENVDTAAYNLSGKAIGIAFAHLAAYVVAPAFILKSLQYIISYYLTKDDVFLDQKMINDLQKLSEKHGYVISIGLPDAQPQIYFSPEHQMKGKGRNVLSAIRTKHGMKTISTELQGCLSSSILKRITNNQYGMFSEQGRLIASCVFLYGSTALMNKHVYESLPPRFTCVPYAVHEEGRHLNVIKANMKLVSSQGVLPDDCILVSVPNAMIHSDIKKFIHTKSLPGSNGHFAESYISYFDASVSLSGDVQAVSDCYRIDGPQNLNGLGALPYVVRDTVTYKWSGTQKGTCGSLLLGYSANQWYILGLHTAGQPSGGKGFSVYLGNRDYAVQLPPVETQCVDLNSLFSIDIYQDPVLPGLIDYVDGKHVCAITTSPYAPSSFLRTPYDADTDYPFAPAHIGKESYELGLLKEQKCKAAYKPCFALLEILSEYQEEILEKALPRWKTRIPTNLTRSSFADVMAGTDGNTRFSTKSARGLRLQYLGFKKSDVFDPDHPHYHALKNIVESYWTHSDSTREFSAQIGYDKQKAEVRDLDRVRAKKTRIFKITDFVDNIMLRQSFGQLVAIFPEDPINGPMTCGIDPRSLAWTEIARIFEEYSSICSLDVEGFEYIVTLTVTNMLDPVILHAFASWQDRISAKWGLASITQAISFSGDIGRILWATMTSGNWDTTWLNSFQSSTQFSVISLSLSIIMNDDPIVNLRKLRLKVYSDDQITAAPVPWWTPNNLAVTAKTLMGITLTNTDKSVIDKSRPPDTIHTIEFLGRRFRLENGVYYAPLEKQALLAQLYYVKIPKRERFNPQYMLQQLQTNVDNVCSELAEYDPVEAIAIREEIGQKLRAMGTWVSLDNTPMESYRKISNY